MDSSPAHASPQACGRLPENRFATLIAAGLIVLGGVAAYANSFNGQFIFDDIGSIEHNPSIRRLWPIWPVLTQGAYATIVGRPLLNLSLALNYAWSGFDVWSYHAVNLVVHLLAALALFGVTRRTLLLPTMPGWVVRDATGIAMFTALVWTVHPLQTESVTYIVQRAESLVGVFYFWTIYCVNRGALGRRPILWYALAVVASFLGVVSKEVIVTVPVVVLLYDRIFLSQSFKEVFRRRWGLYCGLAASWGLLALLMRTTGGRDKTAGFGYGMSPWDYALTQFGAIVGYLRLCVWPDPLILDYGTHVAKTIGEVLPQAVCILCLLAVTVVALWNYPKLGFLGACFFLILAPTSTIIPLVTQPIAEHRMYLPLAALAALAVIGIWSATRALVRWSLGPEGVHHMLSWAAPSLLLAVAATLFGYETYLRNQDYDSTLAMWQDVVRKRPGNVRPYYSIANELNERGDTRGARTYCDLALAVDPQSGPAYLNRANSYAIDKDYAKALEDYARTIELYPPLTSLACYHRGNVYAEMGDDEAALENYTSAVEARISIAECWYKRGLLLKKKGEIEQAGVSLTNAVMLKPDYPEAFNARGHCYKSLGLFKQAIQDYDEALKQWPTFTDALNNRGVAYAEMEQPAKAIGDFTKVLELTPDYAAAYKNRAMCHFDLKHYDQAWADVHAFEKLGGTPNPEFIAHLTAASGGAR